MPGDTPKAVFLKSFGRELANRSAAVFIGAGLSRPAGFVDWKGLLQEVAEELGLDIDKETDLISLAQYHENHTGNRSKLNQHLLDEFTKDVTPTDNHHLVASLPIDTVWTTNYDTLIEDAIRRVGRRPDVKHSTNQLTSRLRGADVTVYKMHGDVSLPSEAVLTRDDYETYEQSRVLFSEKLRGDLISQTFLFLGFSFTDPNIDYILSRIRVLLGKNIRSHYCILKKPVLDSSAGPAGQAEFDYASRLLELRIQDLKRYGIQTVLVDEYDEITEMLADLNRSGHARDVFVSGSAHEFGTLGQVRVEELCRTLGRELIVAGRNVVNGFGLGIGSAVSMSAIEAVYRLPGEQLEARVMLRPFPQDAPSTMTIQQVWTRYRHDMISQAGYAIFLCGNKIDASGNVVEANGVREEFDIARSLGKYLIPIGATGYVAKELWQAVGSDLAAFFPNLDVAKEFEILGTEASTTAELVQAVLTIINKTSR